MRNTNESLVVGDQGTCDSSKNITHRIILVAGTLLTLLVGTFGNMATYFIFSKKSYKKNIIASMFRYQSLLDLLFLYTVVLPFVYKGMSRAMKIHLSIKACFTFVSWSMGLQSLTNWLLVVITVTRLVHLKYPLSTHTICSKLNYNISLVLTHFVVVGAYAGSGFAMFYRFTDLGYEGSNDILCFQQIRRPGVQTQIDKFLPLVLHFIGPALCLSVTNVFLICELRRWKERQKTLFNSNQTSSSSANRTQTQDTTSNAGHYSTDNNHQRSSHTDMQYHPTQTLKTKYSTNVEVLKEKVSIVPLEYFDVLNIPDEQEKEDRISNNHHAHEKKKIFLNHKLLMSTTKQKSLEQFKDKDFSSNNPNLTTDNPPAISTSQYVSQWTQNPFGGTPYPAQNDPVSNKASKSALLVSTARRSTSVDGFTKLHNDKRKSRAVISQHRKSTVGALKRNEARLNNLTAMLIAASGVFVCFNTPFWIVSFTSAWLRKMTSCETHFILIDSCLLLHYAHNSVNFIFFCAIGQQFREEINDWSRKLCFKVRKLFCFCSTRSPLRR